MDSIEPIETLWLMWVTPRGSSSRSPESVNHLKSSVLTLALQEAQEDYFTKIQINLTWISYQCYHPYNFIPLHLG